MKRKDTSQRIEREIQLAADDRRQGKEGQARVRARRAAGWAIKEWIAEQAPNNISGSAWSNLQAVASNSSHPSRVRLAATNLTSRINTENMMSVDIDLLADANVLIQHFKTHR